MALDCLTRFGLYCLEEKRPLADLPQVFPYVQQATGLDDATWTQVVRLIEWWLTERQALDEDIPRLIAAWAFWQTAVAQETAVGLGAETILAWWLNVWLWVIQAEKAPAAPNFAPFMALSAQEQLRLAQQCIVRRPDVVNTAVVNRFWQAAVAAGAFDGGNGRWRVALLLTSGGQAAMGHEWRDAARSFRQAIGQTVRQPQALRAWMAFLRAATSYMGADK
jgi:hypothetical protein